MHHVPEDDGNLRVPARTLAALVVLLAMVLAACSTAEPAEDTATPSEDADEPTGQPEDDPIRVSMMYYGDLANDYDRVWQQGVTAALDAVHPDNHVLQEVTDVPFTEQMTQIIEQAFTQGADLVIENPGGGDLTFAACDRHPDRHCISYYPNPLENAPDNVSGFIPKMWEVYYLQGLAAGMLTESNTVGWIAPFDINFDTLYTNSITLGCQSVNPDCQVRRTVLNSFFDPPGARTAAQTLIDEGADVILGFHDDPTILTVASENDVWSFGIYRPMQEFGEAVYVNSWLLTPIVQEHVENVLHQLADDQFEPGLHLYDPLFSDFGPRVPDEVKEAFATAQQELAEGKSIFTGPIRDSSGELRVEEGEELDFTIFYDQWDWFVEGVVGAN